MVLSDHDLEALLSFAEMSPFRLPDGGWLVVDVELVDVTEQRPHGLRYALVLQNAEKQRVLGFDNSHGYDGALPEACFDHEHPLGKVNKRIPYTFTSASVLISDFFARCETYCAKQGIAFDLTQEPANEG